MRGDPIDAERTRSSFKARVIELLVCVYHTVKAVMLLGIASCMCTQCRTQRRTFGKTNEEIGHRLRILWPTQHSGVPVGDDFRNLVDVRAYDRHASGLGLEERNAEWLE